MSPGTGYLERVREVSARCADRIAMGIVQPDGLDAWDYAQTWGTVCAGSRRLGDAGVAHGDRVAILGETEPRWGVAELATLHLGAIAVPLDLNHPDGILRSIIADAGATALLVSGSQLERARQLMPDGVVISFDDLIDRERDRGKDTAPAQVEPSHPRLLVYTSGTTGSPKGVTLTEGNLTSQLTSIFKVIQLADDESLLSILPLNHVFAQIVNLLGPLYVGASVRFARESTPQAVRAALERGGVTAFGAVPQFFSLFRDRVMAEIQARGALTGFVYRSLIKTSRLVKRVTGYNPGRHLFPTIHRAFGGKLRWVVCGGSYLDPGLAQQLVDWGFNLYIAYGLTEATAGVTVTRPEELDIRTVGRPLPDFELRLARTDDEGIGEIEVRGGSVMAGYWNQPEATAAILSSDGWLSTGDLARQDDRGNVIICGRAKEMICLASGKNVYPQELDDHYSRHALIQEVCVVGLPEPGGGERLHAVVVPDLDEFRRQGIATVEDYIRFEMENLSLELPTYQRVLTYTIWREALPRTPTRKVKRLEVQQRLLDEGATGTVSSRQFEFGEADRDLVSNQTMQAVIDAGRLTERGVTELHPDMNLEFDLGLDSMARAEMIAHLASMYAVDTEKMAAAQTPRELVEILDQAGGTGVRAPEARRSWSELLDDPEATAEASEFLKEKSLSGKIAAFFGTLALKSFVRGYFGLRVIGKEHLPADTRPFVLVVNHVSWGDPFLVGAALPPPVRRDTFFLGYAGHLQGWLRRLASRALHVIPVDAGRRLTRAMQLGAAGLKLGRILMIFPEGERTVDGRLREFKPGTAVLIHETGAPAVPVAIIGAYELWGRETSRPRRGKVTVAFGPPIDFRGEQDQDRITAVLREQVGALVKQYGGPAPQ